MAEIKVYIILDECVERVEQQLVLLWFFGRVIVKSVNGKQKSDATEECVGGGRFQSAVSLVVGTRREQKEVKHGIKSVLLFKWIPNLIAAFSPTPPTVQGNIRGKRPLLMLFSCIALQ